MTLLKSMVLGLVALTFSSCAVEAQTIHLIQAADTDDADIGPGTQQNTYRVSAAFESFAQLAGMKITEVSIIGTKFSCANIRQTLSHLTVGQSDAVVFYYSAHGFRKANDASQFPRFLCSGTAATAADGSNDELGLDEAVTILKSKSPRLILAVADTCNHIYNPPTYFSTPYAAEIIQPSPQVLNMKK